MNYSFNTLLTTKPTPLPDPVLAVADQNQSNDFWKNNWWLVGLTGLSLVVRWLSAPWYIESRDGLFFVRALDHYSVLQMRPHWPGYPVYIWVGKLFYLLTGDPVKAFHLLAATASSLTLWPLAKLAFEWTGGGRVGRRAAVLAGGLWAFAPLSLLGGTEIFSDPLGMLLALTMLWLSWLAVSRTEKASYLLPLAAIVAGLMLGTRLSYISLLATLGYAVWYNLGSSEAGRRWKSWWLPCVVGLSFGLTVTGWFGWQLWVDGWKFISAGQNHLAGHYSEWGGSATTDHNWLGRPFRFAQTNMIYSLGGWWPGTPLERLPAGLGWTILLGLGSRQLVRGGWRGRTNPVGWLVGLAGLPYVLWILLGNDVDLARYNFPLLGLACLVAALGLPRSSRWAWPLVVAMLGALIVVSGQQAVAHRDSPPIGVRLADYARTNLDPAQATMIVNEDTSPLIFFLLYQAPGVPSQSVLQSDFEQVVSKLNQQNRQIYLTALPGTAGISWTPVARLCRDQYLESRGPLEVWIYRYEEGASDTKSTILPPCW